MKAIICDRYLDTLGGGERYAISFAKVLSDLGYNVDIEWKDSSIKQKIEERFGINMDKINIVADTKRGEGYDLCFWISDGSIPLLHARCNILHFQVPFHDVGGKSLINKMKFVRINKIVCNSQFTKKVIDKEYGIESVVIYPPVNTNSIRSKRKENIILYVGRFSKILQSKNQDVLIKTFEKMCKAGLTDWRLILAGGNEVGDNGFVDELKKMSKGYPIEIITSLSYKELINYYGISKIFWSAAGFGLNEDKNPEKVEHFGITLVEAMAGGCVPLVYNAGGHKEIIDNGKNGFLWDNTNELIKETKSVIGGRTQISKIAKESSQKYSYENFENGVRKLIYG